MKQFIQLEIRKDHLSLLSLLDKMKNSPTGDFVFNQEKSDNANKGKKGVGLESFEYAVFSSNKEYLFFSNVFVWVKQDELKVFNIGSEDARFLELGVVRYNLVIEHFFHHYMARFLDASYAGCIKMTGDEKSMEKILGEEVYKALHVWESTCNKEAPIANALDEERWFEFVTKLYDSGKDIDPSDFGQWLSEDCGWPPVCNDVIYEMEVKLGYAISLLRYYGEHDN